MPDLVLGDVDTTGDPDGELARLLAYTMPLLEPGGGPLPEAWEPGIDRVEWAAEVAAIRARHDSSALEAGALYDRLLQEAFGPDPLGIGDTPIAVEWADIDQGRVGLRVYRPIDAPPTSGAPGAEATPGTSAPLRPLIGIVHGGSYWMGGGAAGWRLNDALCRTLAAGVGAVVVNIDHRLAPEHPHPAPVDDVVLAMEWMLTHADRLHADAARLVLFGISSGGNLVAAAANRSLDGAAPRPAAVVLQCPSVTLSLASSRFETNIPDLAGAERIVSLYAAGADPENPDVSPALRPTLNGLPPTLLVTADLDPLTADTLMYAERLRQAGVEVTHHPYPMAHTIATPSVFVRMHHDTVAWLRGTLS